MAYKKITGVSCFEQIRWGLKARGVADIDIPVHQLYASIEKAKELGLVKTRVDKGKYPLRNMISLTQKGMKFSKKIEEMIRILD